MKTTAARTGIRLTHPVVRRFVHRRIGGRRIDPGDRTRGRFRKQDVEAILASYREEADRMWAIADLQRLPTTGSQLNVTLSVVTMALYRAVLTQNVPPQHARYLVADVGWDLYALGGRTLARVARLRARGRHSQMTTALRMLLRFPFQPSQRPGYEVEYEDTGDGFATTWTWCPPLAFVQRLVDEQGDHGELAAFQQSWCTYDWPFNDILADGDGHYERPHTLSEGDDRCDMVWAIAPRSQQRESTG